MGMAKDQTEVATRRNSSINSFSLRELLWKGKNKHAISHHVMQPRLCMQRKPPSGKKKYIRTHNPSAQKPSSIVPMPPVNLNCWTKEMAQSVKSLPCKHEDLNLIPKTHIFKSWVWCACNPRACPPDLLGELQTRLKKEC